VIERKWSAEAGRGSGVTRRYRGELAAPSPRAAAPPESFGVAASPGKATTAAASTNLEGIRGSGEGQRR
jgi:hypothetical protein